MLSIVAMQLYLTHIQPCWHRTRARSTQITSQITFNIRGIDGDPPVSGDLKSGIPADVLTPVHPITREREMSEKHRLNRSAW